LGRPTIPQFKDIQYILLKLLVQMAGKIPSAQWAGGLLAGEWGKQAGTLRRIQFAGDHCTVFSGNGVLYFRGLLSSIMPEAGFGPLPGACFRRFCAKRFGGLIGGLIDFK
jgi:hypothetical protein